MAKGPQLAPGMETEHPLSPGLPPELIWLLNYPHSLQAPLTQQEAHPGLVPQIWALSLHPGRCGALQGLWGL